jgi:hexosaminidase
VQDAYNWDPANLVRNVSESNVLGVEAPLWTETIQTIADIEYMMFPRLVGYAEIGWCQQAKRNWDDYKIRLADHGTRLTAMGIKFYKSPQIDWK